MVVPAASAAWRMVEPDWVGARAMVQRLLPRARPGAPSTIQTRRSMLTLRNRDLVRAEDGATSVRYSRLE